MKKHYRQFCWIVLGLAPAAMAVEPATQPTAAVDAAPATQPATAPVAHRTADEIQAELRQIINSPAMPQPESLRDPEARAKSAATAIPAVQHVIALLQELGEADAQYKPVVVQALSQFRAVLVVFEDPATLAQLKQQQAGDDPQQALDAGVTLTLGNWWKNSHAADAPTKLLDDTEALVKAHPDDSGVVRMVAMMLPLSASPEVRGKVEQIVKTELKGPLAARLQQQLGSEDKLQSLENKPLTIADVTLDGKPFSTDQWKGKVILVDVWATWCGPCRAELPRVKKAYADFHDKGLEVLGVSCDHDLSALKQFLQSNPDMPWPQLFDTSQPGWHHLAKEWGIDGIPTMLLIDKKGVVRSVTARENFEEMIPQLLAEK